MSDKKKTKKTAPEAEAQEPVIQEPVAQETGEAPPVEENPLQAQVDTLAGQVKQQEEKYLRLCAEYDNYRKRTAKEKEASWSAAKAETVKSFLPVYDNLERALKQETADEAYRKGVEMTMTQLKKVLAELGMEEIPALGEAFDANLHSAVMHVDDPELGENVIKEVLQAGFRMGETVVRYAMVVVAN